MTNKRKKLVKTLKQKSGMTYQAAFNIISKSQRPLVGAHERSLEELLVELRARSAFAVAVRQLRSVASPSLVDAQASLRELRERPILVAVTGAVEIEVTHREYDALLVAGAANLEMQVFRVFPHRAVTFAERCVCGRWINCWHDEREDSCFCGRRYRVVFDLPRPNWSKAQGERCMLCGEQVRMFSSPSQPNPLHVVNRWQVVCARHIGGASPLPDGPGPASSPEPR